MNKIWRMGYLVAGLIALLVCVGVVSAENITDNTNYPSVNVIGEENGLKILQINDTANNTVYILKVGGYIVSVSPTTLEAGKTTKVTIKVYNYGDAGTLVVEPVSIPSGWSVDDGEWDLDNAVKKYVKKGEYANFDFYITPPKRSEEKDIKFRLSYEHGICPFCWHEKLDEKSFRFKSVKVNHPPNTPTLYKPRDDATVNTLTPTFSWSKFSDPDGGDYQKAFQLRIWEAPGPNQRGTKIVLDKVYYSSSNSVTPSLSDYKEKLKDGKWYHWHVRVMDNHGAWSNWAADTPSKYMDFKVERIPTKLKAYDKEGFVNNPIKLECKLEEDKFPWYDIKGRIVKFYLTNGQYLGSDTTDSDGKAYLSKRFSSAVTYYYYCKFEGDIKYKPSKSNNAKIVVKSNKGSLKISIKNVDGKVHPEWGKLKVNLYDANWRHIDTKITDYKWTVTFTNLKPGTHYFDVWTTWNGEFWGGGTAKVEAGKTKQVKFTRSAPYFYGLYPKGEQVEGKKSYFILKVNAQSWHGNKYVVKLIFDRNRKKPYDYEKSIEGVLKTGINEKTDYWIPPSSGKYYYKAILYVTLSNGKTVKTDEWGYYEWNEYGNVKPKPRGNLLLQIYNIDGKVHSEWGELKVILSDKNWNHVDTKTTYKWKVKFNKLDLDLNPYHFGVYTDWSNSWGYKEYWGEGIVNIKPGDNSIKWTRNTPVFLGLDLGNPKEDEKTKFVARFKCLGYKKYSGLAWKARIIIDKDKKPPYDFDKVYSGRISKESWAITDYWTPKGSGKYYYKVLVQMRIKPGWRITDGWNWVEFNVKPKPPYIDITGISIVSPKDKKVLRGENITVKVSYKNKGGSGYAYIGAAILNDKLRYPCNPPGQCNLPWNKLHVNKDQSGSITIKYKVPNDAPEGYYDVIICSWDKCWKGCERTPCYCSGCCEGKQDCYTLKNAFKVNDIHGLIKFVENASKFYKGYYDYWYNPSWWSKLSQETAESYAKETLNKMYTEPLQSIVQIMLSKYGIGNTLGAYSLAGGILDIVKGITSFFYSLVYFDISTIVSHANYDQSTRKVLDYLKQLEDNGESIKRAKKEELVKLLMQRKKIIEDLYTLLPDYDMKTYEAATWIYQPGFLFYQFYKAYTTVKTLTMSLYLELQADYLITTYWLSKLTNSGQPKKLNMVVKEFIKPTRLDPSINESEYMGCLRDSNERTEFVVRIASDDLKNLEDPKLFIAVYFTNESGEVYVKKGSKPTESSYDYRKVASGRKGHYSAQIEIPNPSSGSYYVMIKGSYSIYSLRASLLFKKSFFIIGYYDRKSVDIRWLGTEIQEYPRPKVVEITTDKNILHLGESLNLTIKVKNEGGRSSWQSIAFSSPNITDINSVEVLEHNLDYFKKYGIGYEAGASYGRERVKLKYPLFEGGKKNWEKGEIRYVKLRITPEKTGPLVLQIKTVAYGFGVYVSDPPLLGTKTVDQQNEFVYVKKIIVKPPEPKIKVEPKKIHFGSVKIGNHKLKTVRIYNDGNSVLIIKDIARTSGSSDFTYYPFTVPNTKPPFSIPPKDKREICFRFKPSSSGYKNAEFVIVSNDPANSKVRISMDGNGIDYIKSIDAKPDSWIAHVNEEKQFKAIAYYASGEQEDVTSKTKWSSSNPSVVKHLGNGKFKAIGVGSATIRAEYNSKSDTVMAIIKNRNPTIELVYPLNGAAVSGNSVTLRWDGSDPDGDPLKYDLYFGTHSNPDIYVRDLTSESYPVPVVSGKTYYWKVVAKDNHGGKAESEIWSFTVVEVPPSVYNVTVKTSGLDGCWANVWVDGIYKGKVNDNSPIKLEFKKGSKHTISVQKIVYKDRYTRFYCSDNVTTVSSEANVIFNYVKQYKLEANVKPEDAGKVEADGFTILHTTKEYWFDEDAKVTLRAVAKKGYRFNKWLICLMGHRCVISNQNPVTIKMEYPVNATAYFTRPMLNLEIISPTKTNPADAGDCNNPRDINVTVRIMASGFEPIHIAPDYVKLFKVYIGGKEAIVKKIEVLYTIMNPIPPGGTYKLIVQPPKQDEDGCYDLVVKFLGWDVEISDKEEKAVCYGKWIPYVPSPEQVELKHVIKNSHSLINVRVAFDNQCYRVSDWGEIVRNGNNFIVDTKIEQFTGVRIMIAPEPTTHTHTYDLGILPAGTYKFIFKAWGENVKTLVFKVGNQPPVASFTYSPQYPNVNENITFNASSSYDPDGKIVKYKWDFGDGSKKEGKVVTHTYSQAGSYVVTLTVTDDDGATNTTSKVVTVGEDWNPWNDSDSDGGEKITTAELQEAIHCWLNDEPAPKTGAEITTERLQEVIHLWLQG